MNIRRADRVKYNNMHGWKDLKSQVGMQFKIDPYTVKIMDEAIPIVERDLFKRDHNNNAGPVKITIAFDNSPFLPGTTFEIKPLTIKFQDGTTPLSLLSYSYSNPTLNTISKERVSSSLKDPLYGLGRFPSLVKECRIFDPMQGLLGYYIYHKGELESTAGLGKGIGIGLDPKTGKDIWEQMWSVHPKTGIHAGLFFAYIPSPSTQLQFYTQKLVALLLSRSIK